MSARRAIATVLLAAGALPACGTRAGHDEPAAEPWSVTAWGNQVEVFAEVDPLVAGTTARANTHVTLLDAFAPLTSGTVSVVLRQPGAPDLVFRQSQPRRPGIFVIEIAAPREGVFDLVLRIESAEVHEDVAAGRVRVGSRASPGRLQEDAAADDASDDGIAFLKEQQWRTDFATAWAEEGALNASVAGPARVRAPAGGDVTLAAPVAGVTRHRPWPFRGQRVRPGQPVVRLSPRVADERSLPELDAQADALRAEADVARARAARLEELLRMEAVSRAEVERARAALAGLEARLRAAESDRAAARATRAGAGGGNALALRAPWAGHVAEVFASAGQAVGADTPLVRLVRARPVWLDVALDPAAARAVTALEGLVLRRAADEPPLEIPKGDVRLRARAPEVDPDTASLGLLLEVDRSAEELPIGAALEAEILLAGLHRGVVVPASALVDDGGVTVVYEQAGGESFRRREVRVRARQGTRALVEGVPLGARIVTRGGAAVRRVSLLSTGAPEQHPH